MFFVLPENIETTVHGRLPDELRIRGHVTPWGFGRDHAHLYSFLEGPSFDRKGNLYLVDIPYGRILRISPEGGWTVVAEYDGWPNGLAIHKDGRIFIADRRRGLMQLDPSTGEMTVIIDQIRREGLKGLNDLTFASNGDLYFTDQGQTGLQDASGRVYRLRVNGQIDCLLNNVPSPNGLVLTPDEKHLLVAVTRANQIWRLPLHPDGTTSRVAAFITLSGGLAGPDGLAMNMAGGVTVAHCGLGTVWVFDRLGEPIYRIRSCEGLSTTNIAYGGADGRLLFITESDSGCILRAELPEPGVSLYSHAD